MSWKWLIAIVLLVWWGRSSKAEPAKEPSASVDIGEGVGVTFHDGTGVWSDVWKVKDGTRCDLQMFVDGQCAEQVTR